MKSQHRKEYEENQRLPESFKKSASELISSEILREGLLLEILKELQFLNKK